MDMTAHVQHDNHSPEDQLPEAVRRTIRALLSVQGLSVQEVAEQTELTYNTFREHLRGNNGSVTLRELAYVGKALGLPAHEIVRIAETGDGFPLRAEREQFALIDGGGEDQPTQLPFRARLNSVT